MRTPSAGTISVSVNLVTMRPEADVVSVTSGTTRLENGGCHCSGKPYSTNRPEVRLGNLRPWGIDNQHSIYKYLGSPLYRGSNLWDKLDKTTQDLQTAKKNLKCIDKEL